jgi:hypothetical protein
MILARISRRINEAREAVADFEFASDHYGERVSRIDRLGRFIVALITGY